MKNRFASGHRALLLGCCGFFLAWPVFAQLGIVLKTNHERYLKYEPIDVTIVIRNYSGNTLVFSNDKGVRTGHLFFEIDRHNKSSVHRLAHGTNPVDGLVLGAGETKELTLALNTLYDLQAEGGYTVTAQIGHRRLPNDYRSNPITFEVREGIPVVTRRVGLPSTSPTAPIKTMTVSLLLFNDGKGCMYCLRVEDDKNVYATIRLGPQISGSPPQLDADASSDIHILFQSAPRLYSYSVYSILGGDVRLRQQRYYVAEGGIPKLTRAPGYLKVVNGRPAVEGKDYEVAPGSEIAP